MGDRTRNRRGSRRQKVKRERDQLNRGHLSSFELITPRSLDTRVTVHFLTHSHVPFLPSMPCAHRVDSIREEKLSLLPSDFHPKPRGHVRTVVEGAYLIVSHIALVATVCVCYRYHRFSQALTL